jgi:hypothetical protein
VRKRLEAGRAAHVAKLRRLLDTLSHNRWRSHCNYEFENISPMLRKAAATLAPLRLGSDTRGALWKVDMKTSTRTWTSILAAVAALGVAGSAVAQPHRDDRRDDHRDDHRGPPGAVAPPAEAPPARGVVEAPPADPRIAQRVHEVEEQRQRDRKLAIKDVKNWNDGRPKRALTHRGEIATTWGNLVTRPEAQAELKTHADRMARLNRILDIANQKGDATLADRCQRDIQNEINHDARILQGIRDKGGMR